MSASFPPRREALNGLLKRLEGCHVHSVYETGPFGYGLHDWLRSRQVDSMVVSAAHVPGEIGNRVKTDRRDGLKLARTLEAGLLSPIYVPEARQRADRELVRQRQRVQRDRCAAMVRIKSFFLTYDIEVPEEAGAHWSGDFEAWLRGLKLEDLALNRVLEELRSLYFELDRRVDWLTAELRQMARSNDYAQQVELLSTVPGIGWLTALTLVVEIVDFARFPDGEALSSYAGLTPSEHSSGDRIRHGHITRQGNPIVRSVLVESSWILIGEGPGDAPFLRQDQSSPRRQARHRGGRSQALSPTPRHRSQRSALPGKRKPDQGELTSTGDRDSPRNAATAWSVVTPVRSKYMVRHRAGPEQTTCGQDHE